MMPDDYNVKSLSQEYIDRVGKVESASGYGSTLHGTRETRVFIENIVRSKDIGSIIDLPCGDFNWMRKVAIPLECSYTGLDVVPEMISDNKSKYPHLNFEVGNAISESIPRADLIICRDFLFHLPISSVRKVLSNIKSSGSTWLLTTTYPKLEKNEELPDQNLDVGWGFRPINLEIEPFKLEGLIDRVVETDFDRVFCLIPVESIPLYS